MYNNGRVNVTFVMGICSELFDNSNGVFINGSKRLDPGIEVVDHYGGAG